MNHINGITTVNLSLIVCIAIAMILQVISKFAVYLGTVSIQFSCMYLFLRTILRVYHRSDPYSIHHHHGTKSLLTVPKRDVIGFFFVVRMQIMHILACATNSIHLFYHCMLYHCMLGVGVQMLAWASKSVAALADPYYPKTRCSGLFFGTAHGSHTHTSMCN